MFSGIDNSSSARIIYLVVFVVSLLTAASGRANSPDQTDAIAAKISAIERRVKERLRGKLSASGLRWGTPVFIRIFKQEHELEVWLYDDDRYRLFNTYPICSFSGELGPKKAEGDRQAPEGFYAIEPTGLNPDSQAYLSLNIGYPNEYDRSRNWTGSHIMIHGGCISTGCFTLGENKFSEDPRWDSPIEEVWCLAAAAFQNGQLSIGVHVFPFRMDDDRLAGYRHSPHYAFWKNLQKGYDMFSQYGRPPVVTVSGNRYLFFAGDTDYGWILGENEQKKARKQVVYLRDTKKVRLMD